jgi:ELWxxDGT repeat protein
MNKNFARIICTLLFLSGTAWAQTNPWMVADINSGVEGSRILGSSSAVIGNGLYYPAYNQQYGAELWMTEFTSMTTSLVKDIFPGGGHGVTNVDATAMVNTNGPLFFSGQQSSVEGYELWKSDGNTNGTVLVKDIFAGSESSAPMYFATLNGITYFSAGEEIRTAGRGPQKWPVLYRQLYRSDGTSSGTFMVKDLQSNPYTSLVSYLTAVNGLLYFSVLQGKEAPPYTGTFTGLARSDGSSNGTFIIASNSKAGEDASPGHGRDYFKALGTNMVFQLTKEALGSEPWITDGTTQGTLLLKDINPGSAGSNLSFFIQMGGYIYFTADDGNHGQELWRSDGTTQGTVMIADINRGSASSSPQWLTPVGSTLYFTASGGAEGRQLWKYEPGASTPLQRVAIINPSGDCEPLLYDKHPEWKSSRSYIPEYYDGMLAVVQLDDAARIYFIANDGKHGFELWQSDGTDLGTRMVRDVCVNCTTTEITNVRNVLDYVWFVQDDGTHGAEPWLLNPSQPLTFTYNRSAVGVVSATPTQGNAPLSVSFDGSASYDPDGSIILYEWDFGDNNSTFGATLSTTAHTYQTPGVYTATLTVTDNDNATSSATVTITVTSASAYVYVDAQSVTRVSKPGGKWAGRSVITIRDNANALVPGATVTASYSGPSSGTVSGTTASNGTVTLETGAIKNPSGSWCFTVTNVSAAYPFDATVGVPYACEGSPKRFDHVPASVMLEQNHPNPFSTGTRIDFALPLEGRVNLTVYDLLGRELRTLVDAQLPAGMHSVDFNADGLPAGTYIYRLDAHGTRLVRMMQLTW